MASRLLSSLPRKVGTLSLAKASSRRLTGAAASTAINYQQALESHPSTQVSALPNGFTVATEHHPHAQTATVGVWIDSGSRNETERDNGSAHFLEHMAFKGTKNRSQQQIETTIENIGAHLNAYTSREQTVYYAKCFKRDVPLSVDMLSDILQNSTLSADAIERERGVILREQQEVDKVMEEVVFDHLHATAFQGHALGRTILGPRENILSLQRGDLVNYIKNNYFADRMVLVGAGAAQHDELVRLATKHFGAMASSDNKAVARDLAPSFVGSEVRVRNDDIPEAHIAIAVQSAGWTSPDYYTLLVMQSIIGNWDRSYGAAGYLSSRLSHIVEQNRLANSFMSFNTSYADTGLWGIYIVSENKTHLHDVMHFALKEWARLSVSTTAAEVERAKQQLKASLLLSLDGTTQIAEDIGRQMVTTGKRQSPEEVEQLVNRITVADVRRVARQYLWDKEIAVVGVGSIEAMPDFNRMRGLMSRNIV